MNDIEKTCGIVKDTYDVIKDVADKTYQGLSIIFPTLPGMIQTRRAECLINTCKKVQEKLDSSNIGKEQIQYCALRLGIPWVENASLEEDPSLQDLWANLMANALKPGKKTDRYPLLASILKKISLLDAQILLFMSQPLQAENNEFLSKFSLDKNRNIHHTDGTLLTLANISDFDFQCIGLKDSNGKIGLSKKIDESPIWALFRHQFTDVPDKELETSIDALESLGLITSISTGEKNFSIGAEPVLSRGMLQITPLGSAFISACIDNAGGGIEQPSMQEGS